MSPKLFIGPWIGEFGVEILRWQGIARTVARSRPWSRIFVATRPESHFLYQDFATDFVDFKAPSIHTVGFTCSGQVKPRIHEDYIREDQGDVLFTPPLLSGERRHLLHGQSLARGTYRDFSTTSCAPAKHYDILLHARSTLKSNQQCKNWSIENFEALTGLLLGDLSIASVGSLDGSAHIQGTDDKRGIPLSELAGLCSKSVLMVGPSSGPIHFAMHSRTAVVTWIDSQERDCYFPHANPFRVPFCCLPGWNPPVEVVHSKVLQMIDIRRTQELPIDFLVVGTKRSGHHAFIEWLTKINPETQYCHWNDCVKDGLETFPLKEFMIPTWDLYPKDLNKRTTSQVLFEWNPSGSNHARIISIEGASIDQIRDLPEAQAAKNVIFVLRDAPNTAASLKRGIPEFRNKLFICPALRDAMRVYRGYLWEATGRTQDLRQLGSKVQFISYNQWHANGEYRDTLFRRLGGSEIQPDRGLMSTYSHTSGFQSPGTPAEHLDTLNRWKSYGHTLWPICSDPELYSAEIEFHGKYYPLGHAIPTGPEDWNGSTSPLFESRFLY